MKIRVMLLEIPLYSGILIFERLETRRPKDRKLPDIVARLSRGCVEY